MSFLDLLVVQCQKLEPICVGVLEKTSAYSIQDNNLDDKVADDKFFGDPADLAAGEKRDENPDIVACGCYFFE